MSRPYPWFFAINDRPVKFVEPKDGSLDVLAYVVSTGEFVEALECFSIPFEGGRDVDELTREEFDALIERKNAGKPW